MNCPHNLTKTLKYRFNMGDEMSTEDDIKKIFEDRSKDVVSHDPWRYGAELAELTDRVEVEWIVKNAGIKTNDVVVDVGCGTGRHVMLLSEMTRAKMIIGCDFVQENIDFLNKNIEQERLENVIGIRCNATNFSEMMEKESCSLVLGIGVIQYLTTDEQLASFSRCCSFAIKKGGSLILKHPLSFTDSYLLDYIREDMNTRYISMYYNLPELMKFFTEDFELMKIQRTFTETLVPGRLAEIERDPRARQMWIHLEKK